MEIILAAVKDPRHLAVLAIIVIVLMVMRWGDRLWRRVTKNDQTIKLRTVTAYETLTNQVGRAIESGRQLHFSAGRGSLANAANPASVAAMEILDRVAKDGCANDVPPVVTVGDGTLLLTAQDGLRHAFEQAGRPNNFKPGMARFLSAESYPMVYAAAVNETIHYGDIASNIVVGRVGAELPLILEAGVRNHLSQVVGTDDPVAAALATAVTDNVLIGEELLAAGAYLNGEASKLTALRAQDILRLTIIGAMVVWALYQLVMG